jgi:hypothetical protein
MVEQVSREARTRTRIQDRGEPGLSTVETLDGN